MKMGFCSIFRHFHSVPNKCIYSGLRAQTLWYGFKDSKASLKSTPWRYFLANHRSFQREGGPISCSTKLHTHRRSEGHISWTCKPSYCMISAFWETRLVTYCCSRKKKCFWSLKTQHLQRGKNFRHQMNAHLVPFVLRSSFQNSSVLFHRNQGQ